MDVRDYRELPASNYKASGRLTRSDLADVFVRSDAINPEKGLTAAQVVRKTDLARSAVYRMLDTLPGFVGINVEGTTRWYYQWELMRPFCDEKNDIYYPVVPEAAALAINSAGAQGGKGKALADYAGNELMFELGKRYSIKHPDVIDPTLANAVDIDVMRLAAVALREFYERTKDNA